MSIEIVQMVAHFSDVETFLAHITIWTHFLNLTIVYKKKILKQQRKGKKMARSCRMMFRIWKTPDWRPKKKHSRVHLQSFKNRDTKVMINQVICQIIQNTFNCSFFVVVFLCYSFCLFKNFKKSEFSLLGHN